MASSGSDQHRNFWVQVPEARLIASAALLTALHCRGAGASALQPLARSFSRRLSQRCGQQLCCARGQPAGASPTPTSTAGASTSQTNSGSGKRSSLVTTVGSHSSSTVPSAPLPAGFTARSVPRTPHSAPNNPRSHPGHSSDRGTNASGSSHPPSLPQRAGCGSGSGAAGSGSGGAAHGSCGAAQAQTQAHWPGLPSWLGRSLLSTRPAASCSLAASAPRPAHLVSRFPRLPASAPGPSFRSFAASALHHHPPPSSTAAAAAAASGHLSAAAAAAASAAAAAAARTRLGLHASAAYLASVRLPSVLESSLAPYWGCLTWSAMAGLWRASCRAAVSAGAWGLPGVRQLHLYLLSAINALGSNLPATLALTVVELARSSRTASADDFQFYLEVPSSGPGEAPWWQALPLQMASLLASIGRSLWLLLLFAPLLLSAPIALQLQCKRAEWIELLRRTLEAAGPAFIKWGQWAATRHDLFPPDMCSELERLHSQAPAHAFRYTKTAIEAAFGVPLSTLFASIERQPVASGSIGQIHRAVLSEQGGAMTGIKPGTTVAVKVRHPGVGAAIQRDFAAMMAVAHLASLLPSLQHLRLEQTLSQFAAPLREQVDLSREAANLRRFNHNFRKTRHVSFPVPLYPLVTPDVLVETFETGEHITAYIQSEHNPYNHRLSELGSGTMLQMMLVDNLIHSDLHPGNILVRLDPPSGLLGLIYRALDRFRDLPSVGSPTRARIELLQQRWLQPSLVLLDVGMATELSAVDQTNMVGLFRSFAAMDGRACGEWTLRFSGEAQTCPDPEGFRAAMQGAFDELRRMDLAAAGEAEGCAFKNGADALAAVLELVRLHQVSLPGHICAVVVTTLVLEGWSNKLDPDHSVLTQVQAMFEPETVPWSHRIVALVDKVMEEEANHFALA